MESATAGHRHRHLPHWEAGQNAQHLTFRLADSLPSGALETLRATLAALPDEVAARQRQEQIEAQLDRHHGACELRVPAIAQLVEDALTHFDGERYVLHAWVIMPNHVHVLVTPLGSTRLASIVHSWKSYTAKQAARMLGRGGAFWARDYYDRAIRDSDHFEVARMYIEQNPVKAGLCASADAWPYGSARFERARTPAAPAPPPSVPVAPAGAGGVSPPLTGPGGVSPPLTGAGGVLPPLTGAGGVSPPLALRRR